MNKKIALFISSLCGGGAERVFVNLANEFASRDLSIDLVLVKKDGPYLRDVSGKVNIIDLKEKRTILALFPLIKYLREEKPDVLISTMYHVNIVAVLAKIISLSNVKTIIRMSNIFSITLKKTEGIKRIFLLYSTKLLYFFADYIIAVPQRTADDLKKTIKISQNKIKLIYNPTITSKILEKSKEKINHKWLNNKNYPIILGVGRLVEQKDFPTLIRAFARLREKREAKLIILGEGEERDNLEKLIKELNLQRHVSMPGFVENPYVYMAKAGVFVLSSNYEGFGNVLIEAMSLGISLISTNCPNGPAELLKNGKYGKLVPVGDWIALARAIEEVLDNPFNSQELKKRAKDFSVEKIADEYLKLV